MFFMTNATQVPTIQRSGFWSRLKKSKGVIYGAILLGVIGGPAYGIYRLVSSKEGDLVFDGVINNKRVEYRENVDANVMIIRNGRDTYRLVDSKNPTSIDWLAENEPDYDKDGLERVEISREKGKPYTFTEDMIGTSTLEALKAGSFITNGTTYYNNVRKNIRAGKRGEYASELESLESVFK